MRMVRLLAISTLVAGLAIAPVHAGSPDTEERPLSKELDQIFRDLIEQMKPALDELLETLEVLEGIDSIEHYERPEILPNGDIIIRRRDDAPPLPENNGAEPETGPGIRT
jgi:hypothetical protein